MKKNELTPVSGGSFNQYLEEELEGKSDLEIKIGDLDKLIKEVQP